MCSRIVVRARWVSWACTATDSATPRTRGRGPAVDLWETVGRIEAPTLLQYGGVSRVVNEELAKRMASTMPRCQIERIENAGHALFTDQPDAFAASIGRFLAGA